MNDIPNHSSTPLDMKTAPTMIALNVKKADTPPGGVTTTAPPNWWRPNRQHFYSDFKTIFGSTHTYHFPTHCNSSSVYHTPLYHIHGPLLKAYLRTTCCCWRRVGSRGNLGQEWILGGHHWRGSGDHGNRGNGDDWSNGGGGHCNWSWWLDGRGETNYTCCWWLDGRGKCGNGSNWSDGCGSGGGNSCGYGWGRWGTSSRWESWMKIRMGIQRRTSNTYGIREQSAALAYTPDGIRHL